MNERYGLSELILRVRDVARSVAFYRDVVGLEVEHEPSATWAWLWTGAAGRPGTQATEEGTPAGPPPPVRVRLGLTSKPLSYGAAHCGGPAHFAIAVARETIPDEKARLQSLGIAVEGPVTFESWRADSLYFSDPDDNRVELCGFESLNRSFKEPMNGVSNREGQPR